MLARIHKIVSHLAIGLSLLIAFMFVSCATQKQNVALVEDPNGEKESSIPWNKQEKWENTGPLNGVTDRR
ncbi:MAG TPA: hypothetical protein VGM62_02775 [Chthoniobacterales bacterium]|jgi:hypothetical protein